MYKLISTFFPLSPVKHGLEVTAGTLEKRNTVKMNKIYSHSQFPRGSLVVN